MPHVLLGRPHLLEHWWPLFGMGTEPSSDPGQYPSLDELLAKYQEYREAINLKLLDEVGEEGLDCALTNPPPGFEKEMTSIGQTFLLIALHNMIHAGQLTDDAPCRGAATVSVTAACNGSVIYSRFYC